MAIRLFLNSSTITSQHILFSLFINLINLRGELPATEVAGVCLITRQIQSICVVLLLILPSVLPKPSACPARIQHSAWLFLNWPHPRFCRNNQMIRTCAHKGSSWNKPNDAFASFWMKHLLRVWQSVRASGFCSLWWKHSSGSCQNRLQQLLFYVFLLLRLCSFLLRFLRRDPQILPACM